MIGNLSYNRGSDRQSIGKEKHKNNITDILVVLL